MPGLYTGVGHGFRSINAAEGLKGFTLVSIYHLFERVTYFFVFFRDGFQLLLDTQCKVLVNSVSTKSSRMFIEMLRVEKTPPAKEDSELLVLHYHLHAPSSLLISFFAHQKL